MKSENFYEMCRKASAILRSEFPAPKIARTIDLFGNLKPHEREALMLQELRKLPFTREQTLKQHYERILSIRNKAIDLNDNLTIIKANQILKKWTPILNLMTGNGCSIN